MARDYVTIREEQRDGQPLWTFSTVRHDRLKSAPAKVARRGDATSSLALPGARRSWQWRFVSTMGRGCAARLFGPVPRKTEHAGARVEILDV